MILHYHDALRAAKYDLKLSYLIAGLATIIVQILVLFNAKFRNRAANALVRAIKSLFVSIDSIP